MSYKKWFSDRLRGFYFRFEKCKFRVADWVGYLELVLTVTIQL